MNSEIVNVMVHTIDLSDTMFVGLDYVDRQLDAGCFEDSYELMGSVLQGMDSIKRALPGIINSLPSTALGFQTMELRDLFETVRENYRAGQASLVHANLKERLIPAFKNWHDEVYAQFKPYICN